MFALFGPSTELEVVRGPVAEPLTGLSIIALAADRYTLAKRRWRGKAADGREFGFDLEHPLRHGDIIFQKEGKSYVMAQTAEPVLRIALTDTAQAARVSWQIGNMHFPVEVRDNALFVEDHPILRQTLERGGIVCIHARTIFQPAAAGAGHRH